MNASAAKAPTGAPDRRVLTVPNALSLARLAAVPVFLWLFVSGREEAAVIVYGVGAGTDFLDGFIARRTGQITEIGKVLDPLSDRVFILALAIALVARGTLPSWLAIVLVTRDLIVLGAFPALERRGVPRIPVNFTGKTATALLLFGLTCLALSETTFAVGEAGEAIGMPAVTAGAILYWAAGVLYARAVVSKMRAGKNRSR